MALKEWTYGLSMGKQIYDQNQNIKIIDDFIAKNNLSGIGQIKWANLSQEVKENITGGNTAVVGVNSVSTVNVVNNSITPEKTTFFTLNPEHILLNSKWVEGYIDLSGNNGGGTTSNLTENYIDVNPSNWYSIESTETLSGITLYISLYDSTKKGTRRLEKVTTLTKGTPYKFLTNANETYIRISIEAIHKDKLYFHAGTSHEEEPAKYFINATANDVLNKGDTLENYMKINASHVLAASEWGNGYLNLDGTVFTNTSSQHTVNYIPVEPSTSYALETTESTTALVAYIALYDSNKANARRLARVDTLNVGTPYIFQTNGTDAYMRISVATGQEDNIYLHKGTSHEEEPAKLYMNVISAGTVNGTGGSVGEIKEEKDFVKSLQYHNKSGGQIYAQYSTSESFNVYVPISNGKYIRYIFEKDVKDDFVLLASISLVDYNGTAFVNDIYFSAGSNKEFAFRGRPKGATTEVQWFPEHNGVGTAFKKSKKVFFDSEDMNLNIRSTALIPVKTVQLIQEVNMVYPGTANPIGVITLITTINENGVIYQGQLQALSDIEFDRGYIGMLPTVTSAFNQLIDSNGYKYPVKSTGLTEIPNTPLSYAWVNTDEVSSKGSYVYAQTILDKSKSLRISQSGTRNNIVWLEHRSADIQKLYPQVFENHVMTAGNIYKWGVNIYCGLMPFANRML